MHMFNEPSKCCTNIMQLLCNLLQVSQSPLRCCADVVQVLCMYLGNDVKLICNCHAIVMHVMYNCHADVMKYRVCYADAM